MKRIKLAPGIYQDAHGISVIARVGSGARELSSPEARYPLGTDLKVLQARWHDEKGKLKNEQATIGTAVSNGTRGLLAGDVKEYLKTATLTDRRREERKQQLGWWVSKFGKRTRQSFLQKGGHVELQQALNGLAVSDSTKDKYRTALSHVFTVLDGKNAANPFREITRFDKAEPQRRDQPYELIDAILANIRDTGQGGEPSRTKAFLSVEAYAPVTRAQLTRMSRGDVHWDAMEISCPGRKKGQGTRARRKPITPDAVEAFKAFDAANCWGVTPSNSSIRRTFVRARDAAIKELKKSRPDLDLSRAATMRPYDLRHSFAAMVYRQTGSLSITGQLLDHADSSTTFRYAQGAVPAHLKAAGAALSEAFGARPKYEAPATPKPAPAKRQRRKRAA
jgi:integrase